MTNWLDPEDVKAYGPYKGQGCDLIRQAYASFDVLEALAALPEPPNVCDVCGTGPGSSMHLSSGAHEMLESTLHRLWKIARIITGKETT